MNMKTGEDQDSSSSFLKNDGGKSKSNEIETPSISLPKGGGAIKGIDEKFSVNAVNGTAAFSIPVPASPSRGVSPTLGLSYNSGSGNGIFGLGWSLSLPSIKRSTNRELPQYLDAVDSDVFLFSEAEDLVPEYRKEADGSFSSDADGNYIFNETDSADGFFTIRFYRPRIEGLFARIERWTHTTSGEIKWRVITRENLTTLFGWSQDSRIFNPKDEKRIFEWLPEFVFDDKGNCACYIYKKENEAGFDVAFAHNRNRLENGSIAYTNLYLEKVLYGNKTPYKKFGDAVPLETDFMFQTVFDFGEYDLNAPFDEIKDWDFRRDAFSDYKAGFEIRTTRLCRRILLYHFFDELPSGSALVKSLNFEYDSAAPEGFTFLTAATVCGYIKQGDGTYTQKKLPPTEFEYQKHDWNKTVQTVSAENLLDAPAGFDDRSYQFTDLFNEGLSGILTEQATGWFYKHNLGEGNFERAKLVSPKPSFTGLGNTLQIADLDADGGKQIVNYASEPKGFFELDDENEWLPFKNFEQLPNINLSDSNSRLLDLTGDGTPDVLITEDVIFTWYKSEGRKGFSERRQTIKEIDEEAGPHIVFADQLQTIFLADMSGDGLTDIVRIRNGEICYWSNLGYGKFGTKITLDDTPVFDAPEAFNPALIRLADIDGSGTSDVIYLGKNKFSCWLNLNGNAFSKTPFEIDAFPEITNQSNITVADLLGNGVACIVWSSNLEKNAANALRYIDLMNGKKPHLMIRYKNNLGKEVSLEYTPSTKFYIADKLAGKPWITKLHFPVHCISKTETRDVLCGFRFVSSYKYRHGYYDHAEKEFRGFGMVEQTDSEHFEHWVKSGATNITDRTIHQEPVITKQWFHTGAFLSREKILDQFAEEYWYEEMNRQGFAVANPEADLSDARIIAAPDLDQTLIDNLSVQERREALRACKSMSLRSETFALDAPLAGATADEIKKELTPFTVSTHNCVIELLQPKGQNRHAVFVVKESEAISYSYERNTEDPRIAHNLNIKLDEYGNVLESASIVYPRISPDAALPSETQNAQNATLITYLQNSFTNDINQPDNFRLRLPSETKTYQLKGVAKAGFYYTIGDFEDVLTVSNEVEYHQINVNPAAGTSQKRLIEHIRTVFYNDALNAALPLHQMPVKGISFESFQLAYTPALLNDIFGAKVNDALMLEGKFTHSEADSNWWIRSGTMQFIEGAETAMDAANRFFMPISYTDPYGAQTRVKYFSDYFLLTEETEDALQNTTKVLSFDMRTLAPRRMRDANDNISEAISDELGLIKATAVFGKGAEADDLSGINEFTSAAENALINDFFNAPASDQLITHGKNLIQHASTRFVYDLDVYMNSGGTKPAVVASIVREQHFQINNDSPVQIGFEYSNGLGQVLLKKQQAEPGIAKKVVVNADDTITVTEVDTDASVPKQLRWIGNGRTILNNKGNPVKQYEPYFSVTHHYEDLKELVETGVTAILYYDVAGRLIKTEFPDQTFSKTEFDSWKQTVYDQNDTVTETVWFDQRFNLLIDVELIAAGKDPAREKAAAEKAADHADTPLIQHFDTLGRLVLQTEHNRDLLGADEFYQTLAELDLEGNLRTVTDARGNQVMIYKYDMLGNPVFQNSMDAGRRWLLQNIAGNPLRSWDERNNIFFFEYDILHRPTAKKVEGGDGAALLNNFYEKTIYGETLPNPKTNNFRGRAIIMYDTSGKSETTGFDFKGNPKSGIKTFSIKYKEIPDWNIANPDTLLETETFTTAFEYDALNRITRQTAADNISVFLPAYNEAGLLDRVQVTQNGNTEIFVRNIDYNEKGQRRRILYGNNVTTNYFYDRETFRLIRLETKRQNNDPLQDLRYTFDPVGNVTHIEDKNIPAVFFNNQKIEATASYTYDALYRLVEAIGREHAGQLTFGQFDNFDDLPFMKEFNPNDPMAWREYKQNYDYDEVGNIEEMAHTAPGGNWTRTYNYAANNNRLLSTEVGSDTYNYPHHPQHGFITAMPHLQVMKWNFKEELQAVAKQSVINGTPETTYYVYDGSGQRARKITENQAPAGVVNPSKKSQRIYVGGVEIYREYGITEAVILERKSYHVLDDKNRIAMIETRTQGTDGSPARLVRYQFGNHLGSANIETDDSARVISYEEFHPFGTTSYQAVDKTIKAAAKRYRYTGMERDEESGLEYHSARYYLPWLGRWLNADPIGIGDGSNLYQYSRNNPIILSDVEGTEPKRSYQLSLGFDESGFTGDPRADSEANTNLTLLSVGGFNALTSESSHVLWQIFVGLGALYPTVFSHEGGHYREGLRQNANPDMHFAFSVFPYEVASTGLSNRAIFHAGGVNQNMLNSRAMWRNFKLSGGRLSIAERMAYFENQGYLAFYNVNAALRNNSNNDINNYLASTGASRGVLLSTSLAVTGLDQLSQIFSVPIENVFKNKIAAPRFEEYLTSSGDPLFGIQTILRPGGVLPQFEVILNATPTFSDFSFGVKAHHISISGVEGLSVSPFVSLSGWGVSGGADATYNFNSDLGLNLTGGYRDSSNPLNSIEGKEAGWYTNLSAIYRFERRD